MKYYEIIRLSNQDADECFEEIKKLVNRGWTKKAMEYLQQWDYGEENIGPARVYDKVWDTPTDARSPHDRVLREMTFHHLWGDQTQYLCVSRSWDGLYEAYYLTASITDEQLND